MILRGWILFTRNRVKAELFLTNDLVLLGQGLVVIDQKRMNRRRE